MRIRISLLGSVSHKELRALWPAAPFLRSVITASQNLCCMQFLLPIERKEQALTNSSPETEQASNMFGTFIHRLII